MEEDMIMNVPSAPEMQGTPMTPDLSMDMQSEMGEISQSEIQEAQGALMQILQVINMLIEQGLNPEQIKAFLEQYGISEEELEQAAQALGVDIDMVLSGQMQAPQEPMMMAEGGPATNVSDRTQSEQLGYSSFRLAVLNPERADSDMIKKDYLEKLPGITHLDSTSRVQTVNNKTNSDFYKILLEFKKISGYPILLNTSFNINGEPIVCSPDDAINTFFNSGIDILVINNFMIEKKT